MTETNVPTRPMTFGEKLAGISFNPSADSDVDKVKIAAAKFMDAINDFRNNKTQETTKIAMDLLESAYTRALEAQMLAVKAITWKY